MNLHLEDYPRVADRVPPSAHGIAEVVHQLWSEADAKAATVRLSDRSPAWAVDPGTTVALTIAGDCFMSDATYERSTCVELAHHARGNVLIAGLGLGMVLPPLLEDDDVQSVTVVEKVDDVIALIAPHYQHAKLTIERANIFTWRPEGRLFETIYFDIWPLITPMNLIQMEFLHRAFEPYLAPAGWMESWLRRDLLRFLREDARVPADPFAEEMGRCGNASRFKFGGPELASKLLGLLKNMRRVPLPFAQQIATSEPMRRSVGTHVLPREDQQTTCRGCGQTPNPANRCVVCSIREEVA